MQLFVFQNFFDTSSSKLEESPKHFSWLISQLIGTWQKWYWFAAAATIIYYYGSVYLIIHHFFSAVGWLARPVNWQIDIDLQYTGGVSIMMDGWVISMIARPKCLSIKLIKPVNRWLVMDQEQVNATSLGWLMIAAHGRLLKLLKMVTRCRPPALIVAATTECCSSFLTACRVVESRQICK